MSGQATVQMQATKPTFIPVTHGLLQRCTATTECTDCRKKREGMLQRAAVNNSPTLEVPPVVHEVLRSPGQPLGAMTRAFMEPRFGHDFSSVRVHTDAKAAESARAVNALAYTVGRDVVFGEGQYAPHTNLGQKLLAHELTHVLQQRNQTAINRRTSIAPPDDATELEAERIGSTINGQQELQPIRSTTHSVLRQADISQVSRGMDCTRASDGITPSGSDVMFDHNSHTITASGQLAIRSFVMAWMSGQRDLIRIDGYASVEGPQDLNRRLSCNRANAVKTQLLALGIPVSQIRVFAHGETSEFGAGLPPNRRVVISTIPMLIPRPTPRQVPESPTSPDQTRTEDIKVVLKSYIAPIGASIGTPTCSLTYPVPVPVPIPGAPVPPIPVPTTAAMRLRTLAAATDLMMSENPMADTKDKHYRLYSERTFSVTCMGSRLINVVPSQLDTDSGKEGLFQAPALNVLSISARRSGNSTFDFSWAVKGRPHPAVEPPFQLVCPRTSVYIWHVINGQIDCSSSRIRVTATIIGSQFPSHRVFVRGTVSDTVRQGPFRNLWIPNSADPTQVR